MEFSMRSFSGGKFAFYLQDTTLLHFLYEVTAFSNTSSDGESLCMSSYGHGLHSVGHGIILPWSKVLERHLRFHRMPLQAHRRLIVQLLTNCISTSSSAFSLFPSQFSASE
jgi:hypothetical protein